MDSALPSCNTFSSRMGKIVAPLVIVSRFFRQFSDNLYALVVGLPINYELKLDNQLDTALFSRFTIYNVSHKIV